MEQEYTPSTKRQRLSPTPILMATGETDTNDLLSQPSDECWTKSELQDVQMDNTVTASETLSAETPSIGSMAESDLLGDTTASTQVAPEPAIVPGAAGEQEDEAAPSLAVDGGGIDGDTLQDSSKDTAQDNGEIQDSEEVRLKTEGFKVEAGSRKQEAAGKEGINSAGSGLLGDKTTKEWLRNMEDADWRVVVYFMLKKVAHMEDRLEHAIRLLENRPPGNAAMESMQGLDASSPIVCYSSPQEMESYSRRLEVDGRAKQALIRNFKGIGGDKPQTMVSTILKTIMTMELKDKYRLDEGPQKKSGETPSFMIERKRFTKECKGVYDAIQEAVAQFFPFTQVEITMKDKSKKMISLWDRVNRTISDSLRNATQNIRKTERKKEMKNNMTTNKRRFSFTEEDNTFHQKSNTTTNKQENGGGMDVSTKNQASNVAAGGIGLNTKNQASKDTPQDNGEVQAKYTIPDAPTADSSGLVKLHSSQREIESWSRQLKENAQEKQAVIRHFVGVGGSEPHTMVSAILTQIMTMELKDKYRLDEAPPRKSVPGETWIILERAAFKKECTDVFEAIQEAVAQVFPCMQWEITMKDKSKKMISMWDRVNKSISDSFRNATQNLRKVERKKEMKNSRANNVQQQHTLT